MMNEAEKDNEIKKIINLHGDNVEETAAKILKLLESTDDVTNIESKSRDQNIESKYEQYLPFLQHQSLQSEAERITELKQISSDNSIISFDYLIPVGILLVAGIAIRAMMMSRRLCQSRQQEYISL
mmetsp:Transcript_5501/g.7563  ORF Transcript_5501/g.7563 Transcript_5501/m.7563 type:complete len:126 (+) Transcript_5501:120-497(+)